MIRRAAIAFALAAASSHADDAARLTALLDDLDSFRARFEQVVVDRFGETLQVVTGTMQWQRPHRLRWEVDEPYPQLVLADGDSLWVFDPDLEQVSVQPLAAAIEGTPASFLAGAAETLGRQFDVSAEAGEGGEGGEGAEAGEGKEQAEVRFVLTPRDEGSVFRDLTLAFAPAGVMTRLDIADHLGAYTRTKFTDAVKNPALADSLFAFEIPEGVDVIGDPPASAAPDDSVP